MTRYLLDTSTLIDISYRLEPVRSRVRALLAAREPVGVYAVNLAEFMAGLPLHDRPHWANFLADLRSWQITREAALRAGYYRYDFARQGRTVSTADALIAATAWYWQATIVMDNLKDFPMTDIQVVSFRI